eukprot:6957252-Alexandrium_andersonii.AAC.1
MRGCSAGYCGVDCAPFAMYAHCRHVAKGAAHEQVRFGPNRYDSASLAVLARWRCISRVFARVL